MYRISRRTRTRQPPTAVRESLALEVLLGFSRQCSHQRLSLAFSLSPHSDYWQILFSPLAAVLLGAVSTKFLTTTVSSFRREFNDP